MFKERKKKIIIRNNWHHSSRCCVIYRRTQSGIHTPYHLTWRLEGFNPFFESKIQKFCRKLSTNRKYYFIKNEMRSEKNSSVIHHKRKPFVQEYHRNYIFGNEKKSAFFPSTWMPAMCNVNEINFSIFRNKR